MGVVRFMVYEAGHAASITALRDALGHSGFEDAWKQGAALSTDEAITYAQHDRGSIKT
jgi:methylmalonyl-CoA mutase cobalamin-binding subunit